MRFFSGYKDRMGGREGSDTTGTPSVYIPVAVDYLTGVIPAQTG